MTRAHLPDTNAIYQIRVKGILDPSWSDWFDGFDIQFTGGDTIITGAADQAALYGLITKLRNLGLSLLRVELIQDGDE